MIKKAEAVYTGGNIWCFYGELTDGNYFLTDDNGYTTIVDADPGLDYDAACYYEWQEEHMVKELTDKKELAEFDKELIRYLRNHYEEHSMAHVEINAYEMFWTDEE